MGVCPVCGCKTDDLDFVSYSVNSTEEKICSFCEKQLKAFESGNVSKAHLRWLESVSEKQPPERDENIKTALAELSAKFGSQQPAAPQGTSAAEARPQQYMMPPKQGYSAAAANTASPASSAEISALQARISALEKKSG